MNAPQPVLPLSSWDLGRGLYEIFFQVTILQQTQVSFIWLLLQQRLFFPSLIPLALCILPQSCYLLHPTTLGLENLYFCIFFYSVIFRCMLCQCIFEKKSLFLFSFVLLMAISSCRKDKFGSSGHNPFKMYLYLIISTHCLNSSYLHFSRLVKHLQLKEICGSIICSIVLDWHWWINPLSLAAHQNVPYSNVSFISASLLVLSCWYIYLLNKYKQYKQIYIATELTHSDSRQHTTLKTHY